MTGSSTSFTRMLPLLLLPLFISASSACIKTFEFNTQVKSLGDIVKNCPKNCSLVHTTDTCKCFNVSTPQNVCTSYLFVDEALKSLPESVFTGSKVIWKGLKKIANNCQVKMNFCSLPVNFSLRSLHEQLKDIAQRISSISSITSKPQNRK